jgi:hypothetical protein
MIRMAIAIEWNCNSIRLPRIDCHSCRLRLSDSQANRPTDQCAIASRSQPYCPTGDRGAQNATSMRLSHCSEIRVAGAHERAARVRCSAMIFCMCGVMQGRLSRAISNKRGRGRGGVGNGPDKRLRDSDIRVPARQRRLTAAAPTDGCRMRHASHARCEAGDRVLGRLREPYRCARAADLCDDRWPYRSTHGEGFTRGRGSQARSQDRSGNPVFLMPGQIPIYESR